MRFIRISFLIMLTAGFFASCSEQEEIQPQQETLSYSASAQSLVDAIEQHNDRAENKIQLSGKDIQDAVNGENRMPPCDMFEGCCFNQDDLDLLIANFGCTSGCPPEIDLNCDGVINTSDLLILASYFGCADVDVIIGNFSGTSNMNITNLASGQLRNYTTIDGNWWSTNDPTITGARWYVNGVAVSNSLTHLQFQYPGAITYDYAVPCNGYYEVTLYVEVECKVYSSTECYYLQIAGNPTCTENGCM
ncbi:MAG: hypothetical protein KDC34_05905 [Saprospiraceae bacterium]|nr:hypothetical protein [Saprospiraceae bacterium]